jgi:hypothetical protein
MDGGAHAEHDDKGQGRWREPGPPQPDPAERDRR